MNQRRNKELARAKKKPWLNKINWNIFASYVISLHVSPGSQNLFHGEAIKNYFEVYKINGNFDSWYLVVRSFYKCLENFYLSFIHLIECLSQLMHISIKT